MAFITGNTPQGNCGVVVHTKDNHYSCGPIHEVQGQDPATVNHLNFYIRIEGAIGETVHLDVHWPPFEPAKCGPRKYNSDPFFRAIHDCLYVSNDELYWTKFPKEEVRVNPEDWTIHFSLTLNEPVCFVSVNFYYTLKMFEDLRHYLAPSPYIEEKVIGKALDGQDLRLYIATDPGVPATEKKLVYLQGCQHSCEYSGAHVLDALLRYLSSGLDEAGELLRKYEFHVVPIVALSSWAQGYRGYRGNYIEQKDPNEDWVEFKNPETRAIDAYLRKLPVAPKILCDLHNGWGTYKSKSSGANISVKQYLSEEENAESLRFGRLLIQRCDYLPPEAFWFRDKPRPETFGVYSQQFGQGFTLEFSRYDIYDRLLGQKVPLTQAHYRRLGRQLAHVIDDYLSGMQAE